MTLKQIHELFEKFSLHLCEIIVLIGLFATQAGHFITRLSGFALFILMINIFYFGHPDWFVWPPIKLLTSEQIFLFVLSIYFMVRGNK